MIRTDGEPTIASDPRSRAIRSPVLLPGAFCAVAGVALGWIAHHFEGNANDSH